MIERLRAITLFADLPSLVLADVVPFVEIIHIESGKALFSEGDEGDAMYAIEKGAIQVTKVIDKDAGTEKVLATLRQGEFVGEMSLFDAKPRSASAIAFGDTTVIRLTKKSFDDLLSRDVNTASQLLKSLIAFIGDRLRKTNDELVTVYETGRIIGEVHDVEQMCHSILAQVSRVVNSQKGLIGLYNEFSDEFDVKSQLGYSPEEVSQIHLNFADPLLYFLGTHPRCHLVEHSRDWNIGPRRLAENPHYGETMLLAPLLVDGHVLGVIWLSDTKNATPFTWNHRNLLEGVARQVGSAIFNAKVKQEQEQRDRLAQARYGR